MRFSISLLLLFLSPTVYSSITVQLNIFPYSNKSLAKLYGYDKAFATGKDYVAFGFDTWEVRNLALKGFFGAVPEKHDLGGIEPAARNYHVIYNITDIYRVLKPINAIINSEIKVINNTEDSATFDSSRMLHPVRHKNDENFEDVFMKISKFNLTSTWESKAKLGRTDDINYDVQISTDAFTPTISFIGRLNQDFDLYRKLLVNLETEIAMALGSHEKEVVIDAHTSVIEGKITAKIEYDCKLEGKYVVSDERFADGRNYWTFEIGDLLYAVKLNNSVKSVNTIKMNYEISIESPSMKPVILENLLPEIDDD